MKWLYALVFVASSLASSAQNKTVQEPTKQFSMFYGNDVTASKDLYYTNGWLFEYIHPVFVKSPFNIAFFAKSENTDSYHSVRLIYDVFTPDLHEPLFTDRPFAAYLLVGSKHQYINWDTRVSIISELQLGIIGPAVGASIFQDAFHFILPGADPVSGWETQIKNDIGIQYIFGINKQVFRNKFAEIIAGGTTFLGSPYTKAEANTILRMGILEDYFNRLYKSPQNEWQLYAFGEAKASYVVHNATIQGGLLNSFNVYVRNDLSPFVIDLQLGVGAVYKKFGITLGQHYLTQEYDAGVSHSWGYFLFTITN